VLSMDGPLRWKKGVTATLARVAIVAVILYLCYLIVEPFAIPLLWGVALTVVFWPVDAWLRRRVRWRWLVALLSTVLVCVVIIGPTIYLGAALIDEISQFTRQLQAGNYREELDRIINFKETVLFKQIAERLSPWVDLSGLDIKTLILDNLRRLTSFAVDQTSRLVTNFSAFLLDLGVITLTMFFLFRDGDSLFDRVKEAMPLSPKQTGELFARLYSVIRAALYGGVLVAIFQGFLGGLAFVILGLGAPVLWGVVMGFCSFIPVFGAALVYVPASVVLMLQGSVVKGLILLVLGFGVVSSIDNLVRPLLISGRTQMHTLILFVSILGGLKLFGLLGLVMGPVLAAVFISFFEFYLVEMRRARAAIDSAPAADDT